ncbi:MAG: hypothetical protein QOI12_5208 [Alphaproteobacteria bacterium]|nr:hypothetical protein [Alphaproteobacteria bacterium]
MTGDFDRLAVVQEGFIIALERPFVDGFHRAGSEKPVLAGGIGERRLSDHIERHDLAQERRVPTIKAAERRVRQGNGGAAGGAIPALEWRSSHSTVLDRRRMNRSGPKCVLFLRAAMIYWLESKDAVTCDCIE